ncbi:MAG: DUF4105 domain-containing protein [Opitutaceae bacterium]|nr:DUF4105 domain-containing protein [Opitutaceae bacterium]
MSERVDVSPFRRVVRGAVSIAGILVLGALGLWCAGAVYYADIESAAWRSVLTAVFVGGLVAVAIFVRPHRLARRIHLGACAAVIVWFLLDAPSNDRAWQPDVAVLPWAEITGDRVTIHNIRHCDYRSEGDYTVRHEDRTLDLATLRSVDFMVVTWGAPSIAHTMMSFGFADGSYVCISIETRKEIGEGYSAIKGFFRQFELTYVIADERDLVRLRTNFRGEQVYVYRLRTDMDVARQVFLDYLAQASRLRERPEWYNVVTANCTTMIRGHTKPYARDSRFDWRMLINGRIDEMAYERGTLDQTLPFAELKERSLVNARALAAGDGPDFSERIRVGLP